MPVGCKSRGNWVSRASVRPYQTLAILRSMSTMKRTTIQLLIATMLVLSITSCALDKLSKLDAEKTMVPNPTYTTVPRRPWTAIHNWAYWHDNPDLILLRASYF